MIIDFHTHTFPEKIAAAAISKLEQKAHARAHTDGTQSALLRSMLGYPEEAGEKTEK